MGAFEKILKKTDEQKAPPQDMPATPIPNAPSTQVGISKPDKIIKPQQPTPEVPNAPSAQVQINRGPDKIGSTPPEAKQQLSMAQMYEKLNAANKPLTEEQLEEQRKKERRDKMFASIGDGISALSNLFFTTQYAPNMYEGNKSMSERMRVRYDRLKKEREGKEKEYNAGLMNAMKYDASLALQRERERRKAESDEKQKAIDEARKKKYEAAAAKDDATAAYYEAKAKALEEGAPLELALLVAKAEKEKAIANKNKRQGTTSWVSGSGGNSSKAYSLYNYKTGETEHFRNKDERDRRAAEVGYDMTPENSESENHDDFMGNRTSTTKRGESVSAKLGRQEAQKKKEAKEKNDEDFSQYKVDSSRDSDEDFSQYKI